MMSDAKMRFVRLDEREIWMKSSVSPTISCASCAGGGRGGEAPPGRGGGGSGQRRRSERAAAAVQCRGVLIRAGLGEASLTVQVGGVTQAIKSSRDR